MHTPGPWRIGFKDGSGRFEHREGAWITTGSNEVIVQGGEDCGVPIGVRKPEDARLIASAPALLEALEDMVDEWDKHKTLLVPTRAAREAIKQAKGE